MEEYCKSMEIYCQTETVVFKDTKGNNITRTLSYVKDLKKFFEDIVKARDIAEPKFVLGADYGKASFKNNKLTLTTSIQRSHPS